MDAPGQFVGNDVEHLSVKRDAGLWLCRGVHCGGWFGSRNGAQGDDELQRLIRAIAFTPVGRV